MEEDDGSYTMEEDDGSDTMEKDNGILYYDIYCYFQIGTIKLKIYIYWS